LYYHSFDMYYVFTLLTSKMNQKELTRGGQQGGRRERQQKLMVVVGMKAKKHAKARKPMLILFGMFNPRVSGY
jgi:hypothetical protein